MTYRVVERFKSIQGEGVYSGCPMAFIRFVGCSVGKTICQHCDTDFLEKDVIDWRGGGSFDASALRDWAAPYKHICLTGGEPLNQDLTELLNPNLTDATGRRIPSPAFWHVETSGTVPLNFPPPVRSDVDTHIWLCVSPKPGFLENVVLAADEVKVIVPGLGTTIPSLPANATADQWAEEVRNPRRWPTLADALRWERAGKIVFLQPRNAKYDVDKQNLIYVQDLIRDHPQLRLSVQMHKILRVQ